LSPTTCLQPRSLTTFVTASQVYPLLNLRVTHCTSSSPLLRPSCVFSAPACVRRGEVYPHLDHTLFVRGQVVTHGGRCSRDLRTSLRSRDISRTPPESLRDLTELIDEPVRARRQQLERARPTTSLGACFVMASSNRGPMITRAVKDLFSNSLHYCVSGGLISPHKHAPSTACNTCSMKICIDG
jgi:hypothetical protein